MCIKFHDEVATLHPGIGGVAISFQQQPHLCRIIGGLVVANTDIIDQSTDVVGVVEVGFDVEVATQTNGEWLVHDTHLEEIHLGEVGTELGFDGLVFREGWCQQHISRDVAHKEGIVACDGGFSATVADSGLCRHVVQIPTAVLQMVEGGISRQTGVLREDVCAIAFGRDVGREGIDRVLWHEMVQIQILHADVCIVGHMAWHHLSLGILRNGGRAFQLHRSLTFAGDEVCRITWTIGIQRTIEGDTVRDAVVVHRLGIEHCRQEADVLCLRTHLHIGLQPRHIR